MQDLLTLPIIADGEDKNSILKNCVRNNYRHYRKWAKRTLTDCFRVYDRQIHEYPVAIDFYAGRFCIQFFAKDLDEPPSLLKEEVEEALCSLFAIAPSCIYWKTHIKRAKTQQYEKLDHQEEFFTVFEYGVKFRVNLKDYLDTGLFLDHRETRHYVASLAKGKRLLNLFAYTCSFSVHAALAGALYTKSVDLSNTYTNWGKQNFLLNALSLENHEIIRDDCLQFLEKEITGTKRYDIIVLDPPTLSRSKKMQDFFDVQADHAALIQKCLALLDRKGMLFFSTNARKFKLDPTLETQCVFRDITTKTIPFDFGPKKIHRCWMISHLNI